MSGERFNDLVRLTEGEREALLNRLELTARGGEGQDNNRRMERRIDYRRERVPMMIEHPGGGHSRLLVCARNLSGGGMSFIHGGFIHQDTSCKIVLFRADGTPAVIAGVVRNCRSLQGQLHEIGVRFDQRIDLSDYVASQAADEAGATPKSPADLRGTVLIVGFNELDRRLIEHVSRETGVTLLRADDAESAVAAIGGRYHDLVLCEAGSGDAPWSGIEAIRAGGYEGILVAISAGGRAESDEAATTAGADELVSKPFDHDDLMACLVRLHQRAGAVVSADPLISALEDEPDSEELLRPYVSDMHGAASSLLTGLREGDLDGVRSICLSLKGSATGYGFPSLGAAASAALARLDDTDSITASAAEIRRLQLLCGMVSMRGDGAGDGDVESRAA